MIGIDPPTLASYLNSTPASSAAPTTSLNFKAKCPLFEVTTSFPCSNAFRVSESAGCASTIFVGVASIRQSYSTASNTSAPFLSDPNSGYADSFPFSFLVFTSNSSSKPSCEIADEDESAAATTFTATPVLSLIKSFFMDRALATPWPTEPNPMIMTLHSSIIIIT